MSRRSRTRMLLTIVLLLVLASPAWSGNVVEPTGKGFRVIVKIDLFHDDPEIAEEWRDAITNIWNDGPGVGKRWTYCGRPVEFVPDIQVFPAGGKGRPDAHKIRVKLLKPGRDIRSNVQWSSKKFDPAGNSTGTWGSTESDDTIAHEFGHLIGLIDEYEVISEEPRVTRPLPGFEDSLMAERGGTVNQSHIDKAMIANKADCEVWEGAWNGQHNTPVAGVVSRDSGDVRLMVAPDGSVTGGGSILQVTEGGSARHSLTLAGTRTEDAFRLTATGPGGTIDIVVPIRGTSAEGSWEVGAGGTTYSGTIRLECVNCEQAVG
jgi:hypothetical protein